MSVQLKSDLAVSSHTPTSRIPDLSELILRREKNRETFKQIKALKQQCCCHHRRGRDDDQQIICIQQNFFYQKGQFIMCHGPLWAMFNAEYGFRQS